MTAISAKRAIILVIALVAACGAAAAFGVWHLRRDAPAETLAGTDAPAIPSSASDARQQKLATAQSQANAVVNALVGAPPSPETSDGVPSFDVARIEPSGEAVIAGRATPGATVELLRNGEVHDRAVADASGQFVIVPPKLPAGAYDLTLRATQPDGKQMTSRQRVTAALEEKSADRPMVALTTPDKPTIVLSQPADSKPAAGAVVVQAVEIDPGGKFHVSGQARPGAALRLYLNDSFVTSVTAGTDGRFAVTINEGVAPGSYRVRLDETSSSGSVRARAEVPFNVPDTVTTASVPTQTRRPDAASPPQPQLAAAGTTVLPDAGTSSSTVVVPKITTTTVSRGDSLWRLSQLSYGAGTRYAVIYKANREQIRNPNLIYPGQIFVLPAQ